ncbi:MAG: glycosyltransferase family 2 protein [Solirubrobacteraceae bacterium]
MLDLASTTDYTVRLRRERPPWTHRAVLGAYGLALVPYALWRCSVVNWDVWYGPVALLAEIYGWIMGALFVWMVREVHRPVHRPSTRPRRVDALICTYQESLAILEPTVRAACRVRGIDNVLVLDDGNRAEVQALARSVGARYCPRTTNKHAKAGNLNNGLRHSDADFLLVLDADHVPREDFLERTLGYFDDSTLGFVQTPQVYHNRGTFLFRRTGGRYWSEQGMFYDCIQVAKNRTNSAFFVGTSAVLRRRALDSIGGFATGTATEDIHTSLRLHGRGWGSIYLQEQLAFGLEAENLREFYRQRRRWAAGSLGLLFRSPDSPLWRRGLTRAQRASYLSSTMQHLQGVQRLIFFFVPVVCTVTLTAPVATPLSAFLPIFTTWLTLSILVTYLYARGTYHALHTEAYSLASASAHCAGLWGIFKVQKKFSVSLKSTRRRDRTWMKPALWTMFVIGALAIGRDVQVALQSPEHRLLAGSCLFVIAINLILLGSFLTNLSRYERQGDLPADKSSATLRPALASARPRQAALASLLFTLLATGGAVAQAGNSDKPKIPAARRGSQATRLLAPDLVRVEHSPLSPTRFTCDRNAGRSADRVVVGLPDRSCNRFAESVSRPEVQVSPILG